jgi:mannan endo-1,4-beta-mannosidase
MSGRPAAQEAGDGRARRHGGVGNRLFVVVISIAALLAVAAVTVGVVHALVPRGLVTGRPAVVRGGRVVVRLPARKMSYLGAYALGVPASYAPLDQFASKVGVQPNVALYYSGWREPFQTRFAMQAARHHAVPLIQMEPDGARMSAIVSGGYDRYLITFARAVAAFGRRTGDGVIIGFAHEPNGPWYPWGNGHVSPHTWVQAWRRIVTVFRKEGADNVTWLWTINIIDTGKRIANPAPWWPGSRYVTWVGIDGYYYKPTWEFAPLFGPAIRSVRELTRDPILISETGASPAAGKAAKIADLFAGVRNYGLLGLVWFNRDRVRDWRIDTPSAVAAFQAGASKFSEVRP